MPVKTDFIRELEALLEAEEREKELRRTQVVGMGCVQRLCPVEGQLRAFERTVVNETPSFAVQVSRCTHCGCRIEIPRQ